MAIEGEMRIGKGSDSKTYDFRTAGFHDPILVDTGDGVLRVFYDWHEEGQIKQKGLITGLVRVTHFGPSGTVEKREYRHWDSGILIRSNQTVDIEGENFLVRVKRPEPLS